MRYLAFHISMHQVHGTRRPVRATPRCPRPLPPPRSSPTARSCTWAPSATRCPSSCSSRWVGRAQGQGATSAGSRGAELAGVRSRSAGRDRVPGWLVRLNGYPHGELPFRRAPINGLPLPLSLSTCFPQALPIAGLATPQGARAIQGALATTGRGAQPRGKAWHRGPCRAV